MLPSLPSSLLSWGYSSSTSYSYSYSKKPSPYAESEFWTYVLTQLLPLLVLFGLPALVFLARAYWNKNLIRVGRIVTMVLETLFGLSLPLPWGWGAGGNGHGKENGGNGVEERRTRRKDRVRRSSKSSRNGANANAVSLDRESEDDDDDDLFYPGLVNISGTYCFLNSVLQAMASLAYLQPYLDAIHSRAVDLDVPTPVVDTLQDTLQALNTPKTSRSSFRPVTMINALSQPVPGMRGRSKLFASREHQDAQELFQLLSECIKGEAQAVDTEAQRDRGLGAFSSPHSSPSSSRSIDDGGNGEAELSASGVFDGLTANRRSCVACGYTEAVMHFAFATWSLALPSAGYGGSCSLKDCLGEYTKLELLTDCVCRRCSMRATHTRLREEVEQLTEATRPGGAAAGSQYKKKKAREAKRLERLVGAAIEAGRIEEDVKGVKMERVVSPASTKQAMIARPPKTLVLHLNRSVHFGSYSTPSRNPIRVLFPEILDLTPYTTSGQLSTAPSSPISPPPLSAPPGMIPRSRTPTQGMYAVPRVLYRLSAVVVHYGAHSFGHYVCFRRKPRVTSSRDAELRSEKSARPLVPQMPCPYGCDCALCTTYGPVRDFDPSRSSASGSASQELNRTPPRLGTNRGWLRISDDAVEECGLERVLAEGSGAFLLFYERVQGPRVYSGSGFGTSSGFSPVSSGSGVGVGVGVDVSGFNSTIGIGEVAPGQRGLGSIYQHLQMSGSTPRSSEETVRPADVVSLQGSETSASSSVGGSGSVSSSWSGGASDFEGREREVIRPRVVRRTTAGRRERSREVEGRGKASTRGLDEKESGKEWKGKGKGKGNGDEARTQSEATNATENGESERMGNEEPLLRLAQVKAEEGAANGSAVSEDLSESIVKVELPSPPRTPSRSPSPLSAQKERKEERSSQRPPPPSSASPSLLESGPPLAQNGIRPPRTPSPTPSLSPSPLLSPATSPSRKKAKSKSSRIPRAQARARVSSSASGAGSTSGSATAAVGLRA